MKLYRLLTQACERWPNHNFIIDAFDETISYQQFLNRVNNRVKWLKDNHVNQGEIIFISTKDPIITLEGFFAAWAVGMTVMIINPLIIQSDQDHLAMVAEPSVILTNGIFSKGLLKNKICVSTEYTVPALITFTSGTTSKPRGVMLSQESILSNAYSISRFIHLDTNDRALVVKSLHHVSAITSQVILALLYGNSLYFPSQGFNPVYLLDFILSRKITYIDTVATMFKYIYINLQRSSTKRKHSLRVVSINGEHVSYEDLNDYKNKLTDVEILYGYGLSEAGPRVTFSSGNCINKKNSVGKALDGVSIKIDQASSGEKTGEVLIKSPSVMIGYWKNSELTNEKLTNGWLRTGDIGYLDDEGYLYLCGRKDDMIIRGGQNVFPQEIEDVILSLKTIQQCVVIGVEEPIHGNRIKAYIILETDSDLSEGELFEYLRNKLPGYMIPQEIIFCDSIPIKPSGKTCRKFGEEMMK